MSEKIGHLPPFGLRLRPDLKARIQEVAARERRSLNWIITEALEKEFPASDMQEAATGQPA